jgi:Coenzyme PQQ synthesis protein D (PqqD)
VSVMGEGPIARFDRIKRPVAREDGLLVETVGDETVVYDSETKEAHCLNPLAAAVFANCDGSTTLDQLAGLASDRIGEPVDEARITEALVQLQERDLLTVPSSNGLSRRQMIGKSAAAGGALVGASLITTIMAPMASAANTGIPTGCTGCGKNPDCASNHCCQGNPGKECNQGCCVNDNNSCHVCTVNGVNLCTVTLPSCDFPCPPGSVSCCTTNPKPC